MLFNSYGFILLFLPVAVAGYYWLNHQKKYRGGQLWLLILSCFFVGYLDIRYLLALAASVGVNFLLLRLMDRAQDNKKKPWLAVGVTLNVLFLLWFKYLDFLLDNLSAITGGEGTALNLLLPLGISFYTFQQISCLVDVFREGKMDFDFWEYALYVSFFPQFIQGPIVLKDEFLPLLRDEQRKQWDDESFAAGLYAFALGLAKKVLLADTLAQAVNSGYDELWRLNSASAVVIILSYSLQIYFDFSGYCDMALGLAKMFRLDIPVNFNSPYKAVSIADFWDRWHITLTRFFTRYVYIPLGGSRKGKVRTYVNVLLVFLISGLWHGAAWNFVFWGFLHGVAMVLKRLMNEVKLHLPQALEWAVTFVFVNIAWVFFRAEDMEQAKLLFRRLFTGGGGAVDAVLYSSFGDKIEVSFLARLGIFPTSWNPELIWFMLFLAGLTVACVTMKNTQEKLEDFHPGKRKSVTVLILLFWCIISLSGISEFVYFNF